jgi:hypothetical protein
VPCAAPACLPPALAGLPSYPPVEQTASSGAKGGQGASRRLRGQVLSFELRKSWPMIPPLRCLAQPERAEPLSGLARPPEKRAAGAAAGVSSERNRRLARPQTSISSSGTVGGATEKIPNHSNTRGSQFYNSSINSISTAVR